MTKIQKILREIKNLQEFYKRTKPLRDKIRKYDAQVLKVGKSEESNKTD